MNDPIQDDPYELKDVDFTHIDQTPPQIESSKAKRFVLLIFASFFVTFLSTQIPQTGPLMKILNGFETILYSVFTSLLGFCLSLLISAWLLVHSYVTNRFKRALITSATSALLWASIYFIAKNPGTDDFIATLSTICLMYFLINLWSLRVLLRKSRYRWSPLLADLKSRFNEIAVVAVLITNPILLTLLRLYSPLKPPGPWRKIIEIPMQEWIMVILFHSWIMVLIATLVWLQLGALRSKRTIYIIGCGTLFLVGPVVELLLSSTLDYRGSSFANPLPFILLFMTYQWLLGFMLGIGITNKFLPRV